MLKRALIIYILFSTVMAELKVGDEAPTFFAKSLDNRSFFLSDSLERNQRPIVLSFFATWCGPCRQEIPVVDTISTLYPQIDFYLVNVSGTQKGKKTHREDPNLVKIMAETLGPSMPVLMDKYANAANKYDALILPRLVVIDSKGKIAYAHTGYDENVKKELIIILKSLTSKDE